MAYPERVETERLLLRRWQPEDLDAMEAIWADPAVQASLASDAIVDPRAVAEGSLRRQLGQWEREGFGLWAAEERGRGEVIGWAGAWRQDIVPSLAGEVEVGWTLRRAWWGRGLALEGATAGAETAFGALSIQRLISLIHPANRRSIAVATRLGMRLSGDARHGERRDLLLSVYSLPRPSSTRGASPHRRSSR